MGSTWSRLRHVARTAPNEPEVDDELDASQEAVGGRGRRSDRSGQTVPNVLFGLHFLMGGERYDLSKPGAFLFGENWDLELLGNKPVQLHYESGQFFPVVIEVRTEEYGLPEQVQTTLASVEQSTDHSQILVLKPLKQKLIVDGVTYLLQEIFGIENKDYDCSAVDENGSECIICMSDVRDTVILPCRHLCICNGCAETLRYKLNNCPICRSPFRALLQLKTMRVVTLASINDDSNAAHHNKAQTKYETSTLVEALNGPVNHVPSCVSPMSSATVGDAVTTVNVPSDTLSRDHASSNLRASVGKANKARSAKIQQVLTMKPTVSSDGENQENIEMQSATLFKQNRTCSDLTKNEECGEQAPVGVHSVEVECEEPEELPPIKRSTSKTSMPHSSCTLSCEDTPNAHATLVVVESVDLQNTI
ncbi:hypothetical protein QR680_002105 [Steinernema hermaphroditum]|uniref:RING-type domain-containing protein n=1 Tax=Steinernema hermaphroditum TaxID=289476 RepID=A0AA39H2Z8_9BILA|nr:hypothetical protein QR680_002105 [Steinernema hermaphroditum]